VLLNSGGEVPYTVGNPKLKQETDELNTCLIYPHPWCLYGPTCGAVLFLYLYLL